MSQTKYRLPDDLKMQCISLVRGYDRRVLLYHERRNDILYASPPPNIITLKKENGEEIADWGRSSGVIGDSTYNKALQLEKIEQLFDTRAMKAVEQAKVMIGVDYEDNGQRHRLSEAIWDSCIGGRNFKLDHYPLSVGRDNFYERRRGFLYQIAKNMGFL